MKKLLFMVAALAAFAFTSCNSDDDIQGLVNNEEMEEVTLTVGVDNGVKTKAGETPATMTLTGGYNIRYILGVYKVTGDSGSETYTLYKRIEQIYNSGTMANPEKFTLVMPKNGTYQIVAWVDYTKSTGDEFYTTTPLEAITMKNATIAAVDPAQDAYTASAVYVPGATMSLVAKRPFAQVNIIATDNADWKTNLGNASGSFVVAITYTNILSTFNAITEKFTTAKGEVKETCSTAAVSNEFTATNNKFFSGFVFADADGDNYALSIAITATTSIAGDLVPTYAIVNVPLKRNYRTNISGALLLGGTTEFTITTDTRFESPDQSGTWGDDNKWK